MVAPKSNCFCSQILKRLTYAEGSMNYTMFVALFVLLISNAIAGDALPSSDKETTSDLPSAFQTRWYTPDRRYSQTWGMRNIDITNKKALLSFDSTRFGCSMRDSPATITLWDGKSIHFTVDKPNDCFGFFRVELEKVGPRKLEGRIEVDPKMPGAVPTLHTSVTY